MGRKPEGNGGRVIKRYPNRKLYDTAESRYITLNEIAALLREGHEVSVFDSRTGEDITSLLLPRCLSARRKPQKNPADPKMAALIHSGGSLFRRNCRS